jgi:hypothetical protein
MAPEAALRFANSAFISAPTSVAHPVQCSHTIRAMPARSPGAAHPDSYPLIACYRGFCRWALGKNGRADFDACCALGAHHSNFGPSEEKLN